LLSFYREFFSDEGHEVRLAHHGAEGIEIVKEWTPDLILVDLEMPVMTGEEFLEALDNRIGWTGGPVVVVSGSAPRLGALKRPGTAILRKPFVFENLRELVSTLGRSDV
jgi:CheY-like chemotaxis protein